MPRVLLLLPTTTYRTEALAEAKAVSGIEDVAISAQLGQRLVPLPEGSRYLGFIFAKADSPQAVEAALRESHSKLKAVIEPSVDRAREHGSTSLTAKSTEAV